MKDYASFLVEKSHTANDYGFAPAEIPSYLFDFQAELVEWALARGRAAIFADCGLGKTPMQLVWADNVVRHSGKPVLILTPLAVSAQTVREAEKFGIEARVSRDGRHGPGITVTNYERLAHFECEDFAGVVCDESSILKNFDGATKAAVTEFMRTRPYRLLCTATAAPNDYTEMGTSAEALGVMGHMDMLTRFFRNVDSTASTRLHQFRFKHKERLQAFVGKKSFWRFKHHAEEPFWRWVCSWARALRRPSDYGYSDDGFVLPPLDEFETVVPCSRPLDGKLFVERANSLHEQREERRLTIQERCEAVAVKVSHERPALVWCHLNDEGDLLERLIPDAVQVKGSQSDDEKEELLLAFSRSEARVLITKPRIGGFGMNWQHCAHVTFYPSHSYEQYYQGVRRCWRFGQRSPVTVDVVTTEGELAVLANLQRKAQAADLMFDRLVAHMNDAVHISESVKHVPEVVPSWL